MKLLYRAVVRTIRGPYALDEGEWKPVMGYADEAIDPPLDPSTGDVF